MEKAETCIVHVWSKYGAAKLRLFIRDQRESRMELNVQLRSALKWWLRVLPVGATTQEIPKHFLQRPVLVTYSDGEGSYAGVGVVVWGTTLTAFLQVSREGRMMCSSQSELFGANFRAVDPLVILASWPGL